MNALDLAQPDVMLRLDDQGIIREASLSDAVPGEGIGEWVGRRWSETVGGRGGEEVLRLLSSARKSGVSPFREIAQRFPNGLEIPMEYTAVRLGGKAGVIAIGRNLRAVSELRDRLIAAQQEVERDHWRLRQIETRYRLLFDTSNDAIVTLDGATLRLVDANPSAHVAFGLTSGDDFLAHLAPAGRERFRAMLARVKEQGKTPGLLLHLGAARKPCVIRASHMPSEPGAMLFLLHLAELGVMRGQAGRQPPPSADRIIERLGDGFVVFDRRGVVHRANRAFLDLVEMTGEEAVIGEMIGRWLIAQEGDTVAMIAAIEHQGAESRFNAILRNEHGARLAVEITAAGDTDNKPIYFGALVRDLRRSAPAAGWAPQHALLPPRDADEAPPLRDLIRDATQAIERYYIEAALAQARGNRTLAAERLGLSRQSLYNKMERYGLAGDTAGRE